MSWSLDSYLGFGNPLVDPDAFYEYSQGQPITNSGGFTVQIAGTPLNFAVYRLGDAYIAARSNEFCHANYEIEAVAD